MFFPASANHFAGADIRFVWLANNSQGTAYRVFVTIYRDCTGIEADQALSLYADNKCNATTLTHLVLQRTDTLLDGRPNGSQVGGFCPGSGTRCNDPYNPAFMPGFQEWCYSADIIVPFRCETWRFWAIMVNRNESTNIFGGRYYSMLLEATLNNLDAPNNSSPFFTTKPTPYVCVNEPFSYNQGAVDPDGDSLSYELVVPMSEGFQVIPFAAGYSLSNPFATANGFSLDPVTGQMHYTPSLISNNTISVRVTEWRNGKRVGSVVRDVQNVVIPCNSQVPDFKLMESSISGGAIQDSTIFACADIPLRFCFNVPTLSGSSGGTYYVTDNHRYSIPASGVSYNEQRTDSVTGCFSWLPGKDDVGYKVLVVKVRDSSCKLSNVIIDRSYSIPIVVRSADRGYRSYTICPDDSVQLHSSYPGEVLWTSLEGDLPSSLSCIRCSDPVARPEDSTRYLAYQDMGGGCVNMDTVDVRVDRSNRIEITPSGEVGFCEQDTLRLRAETYGARPLSNVSCGAVTRPASSAADTVTVYTLGSRPAQQSSSKGTTPFSGSEKTAMHQYLLRAEDMRSSGLYAGSLNSISIYVFPSSANVVYRNVRISVSCTDHEELKADTGFLQGGILVYRADSVVIPAAGGWLTFPFSTLYNRDRNRNLVFDFCYSNSDMTSPASVSWTQSGYSSVLYAASNAGNLCTYLPPTLSLVAHGEMPLFRFGYYLAPEEPFRYEWSSSRRSAFSPSYTHPSPSVFISRAQTIEVSTVGRNGCKVEDVLEVHLAGISAELQDTVICTGNSVELNAQANRAMSYAWYENGWNTPLALSCKDCPVTVASPLISTGYTVVVEDSFQCRDTALVHVEVVATKGQVRIMNSDTTIDAGATLHLLAEGSYRYEWQPASMLDRSDIPDPSAAHMMAPVRFVVTGFTEDGCRSQDSVYVDIDYRGKIFVPSAFTPNGDGRNDLFRIANLTFQEVLDFRVYNRWGQMVYESRDRMHGWDGTFKGAPQELGTYFYYIRVGFADGTEQTFTGDVSLIR